jgi:hypothetical protein
MTKPPVDVRPPPDPDTLTPSAGVVLDLLSACFGLRAGAVVCNRPDMAVTASAATTFAGHFYARG